MNAFLEVLAALARYSFWRMRLMLTPGSDEVTNKRLSEVDDDLERREKAEARHNKGL